MKLLKASDELLAFFIGLQHYMSTADHIGEGVAWLEDGGRIGVGLPYNPRELEDKDNYERLASRLRELKREGFDLTIDEGVMKGQFKGASVSVRESDLPALTKKLREAPGALGWGSLYTFLQRHGLAEKTEAQEQKRDTP